MATIPHHIFTLSNGIRMAFRPTEGPVSYIGAPIKAGSRDESPDCHGLAHLVEHTIFKGTSKRRSHQISSRMEAVGGELNAYTSKEETMIYTNAPAGYEDRAFELLADLIGNARFPSEEVERERDVVIEEIHSYLDTPSESVYDEFEELAFAGSPLAHNILGTPESVRRLGSGDCLAFVDSRYTPDAMVLYCAAPLPPAKALALAERRFGRIHRPSSPLPRTGVPPMEAFDIVREKGNHQANAIAGFRTFSRNNPRRYALYLLNNYLGGPSMNSRLNRELRDKRGYVYTVDSSVSLLSDTGLMAVYFGCDPSAVGKCRRLITRELDRLAQSPLPASTLERAKTQYCGQLTVSSDHRESQAMAMAKSLMHFGEVRTVSFSADMIRAVSAEELRSVAESLVASPQGFLALI